MANFLAIETTSIICSVALSVDGQVTTKEADGAKSHTQSLLAFIDELLSDRALSMPDLDAIIFAAGPGAFTGVRLAAAVAKSLAYAANIPVVAVSSLAAIAQTALRLTGDSGDCWVITDARMDEVYRGYYRYQQGVAVAEGSDELLSLKQVQMEAGSVRVVGDAKFLLQPIFPGVKFYDVYARAEDLLVLGAAVFAAGLQQHALTAQAMYLRDKTSWKNTEQQQAEKSSAKP